MGGGITGIWGKSLPSPKTCPPLDDDDDDEEEDDGIELLLEELSDDPNKLDM